MTISGACESCGHMRRYNEYGGYCRRNPPIAVAVTNPDGWGSTRTDIETHWPFVVNADGCAEHKEAA